MIKLTLYFLYVLIGVLLPSTRTRPLNLNALNQISARVDQTTFNSREEDSSLPKEIPIIAYHQIRPVNSKDKGYARSITISPEAFAAQMKILHDSGFYTVLPDQLYQYLTGQIALPGKPIMISFDDGTIGQYTEAAGIMKQYEFKAVFFIMTISIDKPAYLNKSQIKKLFDEGHVIGNHTWDHHNVKNYVEPDWKLQLDAPQKTLENIIGHPIQYFAYPYGAWNEAAARELQKRHYKLAFILHTTPSVNYPLLTVRRLMANSSWTPAGLITALQKTFQ